MFVSIPKFSSVPIESIESLIDLTLEEKNSITDYTDILGNPLNEALISNTVIAQDSRLYKCDKNLSQVFDKANAVNLSRRHITKLYRGYGNSDPFELSKAKEVVESKKYLSTTFIPEVAMDVFKGNESFTIVFGHSGINITNLSKHYEGEILFKKNLTWNVLLSEKGYFRINNEKKYHTRKVTIIEEADIKNNCQIFNSLVDTPNETLIMTRRKSCTF